MRATAAFIDGSQGSVMMASGCIEIALSMKLFVSSTSAFVPIAGPMISSFTPKSSAAMRAPTACCS